MKIEEVDKLVEPLGWERDLCHNGDCFPKLNENTVGHEGSYKKFNMTGHGEDGYISYQSLNEIIETVKKLAQLTIPKSVADELDWDTLLDFVDRVLTPSDLPKRSARYEYSQTCGIWYYNMVAYLNPVTKQFVKVVEDEQYQNI